MPSNVRNQLQPISSVIYEQNFIKQTNNQTVTDERMLTLSFPCRYEEAAAILYGENTFAFHVSGLASDGEKIPFLESLGQKYVRLLKRVYIRTGYGVDTYGCASEHPPLEFGDKAPTLEEVQQKIDCDLAISTALVKEAWPARYSVEVDGDGTVKLEGGDGVGLLRRQKVMDWSAGAFHLWKMFVVEGRDGEMRRVFRRVEWMGMGRKGVGPVSRGAG